MSMEKHGGLLNFKDHDGSLRASLQEVLNERRKKTPDASHSLSGVIRIAVKRGLEVLRKEMKLK